VDHGPAATPAQEQGRVRDDTNAELLAANMVQSWVESTRRRGPRTGPGRGGSRGKGRPGSGQDRGTGGHASAHRPGDGDYPALDTSDSRYRKWYLDQRESIERALEFPKERALAMDQGTSVYRLIVRQNGTLQRKPELLRSSGFEDFDDAARAAIRNVAPFDPWPRALAPGHEAIRVTLGVEFANPMVR
jgi:TonB family protein